MKARKVAQIIFALIAMLLGGFWFLQGIAILNICPILCFADCACVEGGSLFWPLMGVGVFIIGIVTTGITTRQNT
jgi:hypothetical protein